MHAASTAGSAVSAPLRPPLEGGPDSAAVELGLSGTYRHDSKMAVIWGGKRCLGQITSFRKHSGSQMSSEQFPRTQEVCFVYSGMH